MVEGQSCDGSFSDGNVGHLLRARDSILRAERVGVRKRTPRATERGPRARARRRNAKVFARLRPIPPIAYAARDAARLSSGCYRHRHRAPDDSRIHASRGGAMIPPAGSGSSIAGPRSKGAEGSSIDGIRSHLAPPREIARSVEAQARLPRPTPQRRLFSLTPPASRRIYVHERHERGAPGRQAGLEAALLARSVMSA